MPTSEIFNTDCLAAMREMPDKCFELAIVDPPYGLDIANSPRIVTDKGIKGKNWDVKPCKMYFDELRRVSKNQIILGGNYFELPPTKGFIFWYKQNPAPSFADGEYAWTSFDIPAKCADLRYYGIINSDSRIHPTQKPVALYKWLLKNYAKPGDRILDTHLGSGSSRIAAYDMGLDFVGYELDAEYFEASDRRFKNHISNLQMFTPEEMYRNGSEQARMF